jgi:hypothetical protein
MPTLIDATAGALRKLNFQELNTITDVIRSYGLF